MRTLRHTLRAFIPMVVCVFAAGAIGSAETPPVAKERFHEILKLKGEGAYARALDEAKRLAPEHPDFEAVYKCPGVRQLRRDL